MGYILPVNNYQYSDYHARMTERKRKPFYIEKPFKVVLEKEHQEISKEHERLTPGYYQHTPYSSQQHSPPNVTGKGMFFNEMA
ncbi:hypothetical protein [Virgibacillus sp. SK37]|uniref:hypothetical protein n=1 Tax=Virgibacillus sp. SK37 TaxID=403957 RepID=UPI0004D16684|nr:hypothetical protein [Virgibacillus sp. SK37]AIF45225.1 hypothetical protein X953_05650 [Virgibacillus sp. SK37]